LGLRKWTLGQRPAALRPNSGEPAAGSGRAQAGKRPAGPPGSIPGLGWVETAASGAARWRRGRAAAGAHAQAKGRRGLDGTRAEGVEWVLGKVPEQSGSSGSEWRGGSAGAAVMALAVSSCARGEGATLK
jgi:hypothetical protein